MLSIPVYRFSKKEKGGIVGNMQIVAVVESDDYGPAVILDPEHISIMNIDDFFIAATRCVYTNQPISCEISQGTAEALVKKGVHCFNISSLDSTPN